jgi:hypothetical protein
MKHLSGTSESSSNPIKPKCLNLKPPLPIKFNPFLNYPSYPFENQTGELPEDLNQPETHAQQKLYELELKKKIILTILSYWQIVSKKRERSRKVLPI